MMPSQVQYAGPGTITDERLRAQEVHLENLVMRCEYDIIANGKLEQRQSKWTWKYEDPPWVL